MKRCEAPSLGSSHSRPRQKHVEPRSRYQREFVAWPEQVSFFLVDHRHCRPAANETMLGLRRAVGTEVVHRLGANKPAYKLDPGFLEHPRLSPRAVIGPGARFLDFLFTGAPRRRRNPGGGDGAIASTMLRS